MKTAIAVVRKKILLVGHADGLGGAQTAFRKLYDFARNEGHDVRVVCMSDRNRNEQYFSPDTTLGCIAHTGSAFTLRTKKARGLANAAFQVVKFQPGILVGVGLNNSVNWLAQFTPRRCFKLGQDFIAGRALNDPLWEKSKQALDGIAVQSPSMLRHWQQEKNGTAFLTWLPCFPEPPVAGILHRNRDGNAANIRLAYFGRLAANKGLPLLLTAFAAANETSAILHLWGKGPEEEALKKQVAELNLQSRVTFCGRYPQGEEGAHLMAGYDALLLCSTGTEGLPLILLEAMAYGLPFLATNVGAISDCCHHNPDTILVQPTLEGITGGLRCLLQRIKANDFHPQRLQTFYRQNFSCEVMAERWRTCFANPVQFFANNSAKQPAGFLV